MTSKDSFSLGKMIKAMKDDKEPFSPLFDQYLLQRGSSSQRIRRFTIDLGERMRPGGRISPSAMGGCLRQAAFKFLNMPGVKKVDPDTEMIFEFGNWHHHMVQVLAADMELVLGSDTFQVREVEGNIKLPELYISGWFDIYVKIRGKYYMIDIKTIRDDGFQRIQRDGPIHSHRMQLHPYMKGKKVPRGILYYINKNNQLRKGFAVPFSQAIWEEVQEWASTVIRYMRRKELPPMHPECVRGNFMYDRCPFAKWCYGDKSPRQVERRLYRDMTTVKAAWREGNRVAG